MQKVFSKDLNSSFRSISGKIERPQAINKNSGILFLMYHGIYNHEKEIFDKRREWVHIKNFEEHCKILIDKGYNTLSMDDYYHNALNGDNFSKSIIITFDDAPLCQLKYAVPTLLKYNLSAIFYIPVKWLNQPHTFSDEDIKKIAEAGMEIGSHSMTHSDFRLLSHDEIYKELRDSKDYLEQLISRPVKHFSFPFGRGYKTYRNLLRKCSYHTAVTVNRGLNNHNTDVYALYRTALYIHSNSKKFEKLLTQKHFLNFYIIRYTGYLIEYLLGSNLRTKLFSKIHSLQDFLHFRTTRKKN